MTALRVERHESALATQYLRLHSCFVLQLTRYTRLYCVHNGGYFGLDGVNINVSLNIFYVFHIQLGCHVYIFDRFLSRIYLNNFFYFTPRGSQ